MSRRNKYYNKSIVKQIHKFDMVFILIFIFVVFILLAETLYFYYSSEKKNMRDSVEKYATDMEYEFDKIEKSIYVFMGDDSFCHNIVSADDEDFLISYNAVTDIRDKISNAFSEFGYIDLVAVYNKNGDLKFGNDIYNYDKITKDIPSNVFCYYTEGNSENIYLLSRIISRKGNYIGNILLKLNILNMNVLNYDDDMEKYVVLRNGNMVGRVLPEYVLSDSSSKNEFTCKNIKLNDRRVYASEYNSDSNRFIYGILTDRSFSTQKINIYFVTVFFVMLLLIIFTILFSIKHINRMLDPISEIKKELDEMEKNNYAIEKYEDIESENEIYIFKKHLFNVIEKMNKYIEEKYEAENCLKEAQLKQLYWQINPHFLYNTLNVLYWKAEGKGQEELALVIKDMGELFRYSTDVADQLVQVKKELEIIKAYISIYKMHFDERLDFSIDFDVELGDVMIPKFSMQPFVENAIMVMTQNNAENFIIKLSIKRKNNSIEVCVLDSGDGIEPDIFKKIILGEYNQKGMSALYNIDRRIKIIFGEQYGIFSEKRDGMSAVGFIIPL